MVATSDVAKKIIPYGKVAVLYSKEKYNKHGKDFATMLKGNGNSVTHVVLPDNFTDSIENYSHLFNLAEDIRLVVSTDYKLYNCAKYFASVRSIDCLLIVDNLNSYGLLEDTVLITNGGYLERVKVSLNMHVLIDYDAIRLKPQDFADTYAFIVSHALALTDYRIYLGLGQSKPNKTAFALAIKSVTNTYQLLKHDKQERLDILLNDLMCLEIANANVNGKIYQNFACATASYLLNGDKTDKGKNRLLCAIPTARLYGLYLSGDYDKILETPNYLESVDFICENFCVSRQKALDVINNQYATIKSNVKNIKKVKQLITNDVNSFIDCCKNMLNTFIALGGNDQIDKRLRDRAIKHSGDLAFNCFTLVRESGIAEYI